MVIVANSAPVICDERYFDDFGADGFNAYGYNEHGTDRKGYRPRIIEVKYPCWSAHDQSYDEAWLFKKDLWDRYRISGDKMEKVIFAKMPNVFLIYASDTANIDEIERSWYNPNYGLWYPGDRHWDDY